MTCIAGIVEAGKVYIGGDSAGIAGYDLMLRADPKVFRKKDCVIGFTSSFRMGQLLRYSLHAPNQPDGMDVFEYMATLFVENVRECFKAGGYTRKESEQEYGGIFLAGYAGRLFGIDGDFQVFEAACGYAAIGSGAAYALGAIHASKGRTPRERLQAALIAAQAFSTAVREPFVIEEL
jgi:ATP-dependent protease HslVU (ClpYQ) peptidase subunit